MIEMEAVAEKINFLRGFRALKSRKSLIVETKVF